MSSFFRFSHIGQKLQIQNVSTDKHNILYAEHFSCRKATCKIGERGCQFHLLLRAKIPKAQKNTVKSLVFVALLGSALIKARHKMLANSTPGLGRR